MNIISSNIISSNYIKNIIGIDIGNGLMCPILSNGIIPCVNQVQFIVPVIMDEYKIDIYIGNNILSSDNILLNTINITSPEKIVYIEFKMTNLLYYNRLLHVIISTKTKNISEYLFNINEDYLNNLHNITDRIIDVYNYQLKFDLIDCIKTIQTKIDKKNIILNEATLNILNNKFKQIIDNIDLVTNQKLLDIKNNLKLKFFI
jgi:hypothetical protein